MSAFGASGIPWDPKRRESRLFAYEEGGVEPVDSPVSPKLAQQFGYSTSANLLDPRVQAGDAQARAGVLAGGYKPMLQDPGGDRRAATTAAAREAAGMFGLDPATIPARTPTRAESAQDDAFLKAQVAPMANAEARRTAGKKEGQAGLLADIQLTDAQRAAAFRQTFQEMTGREYSPEAVKEVYQREYDSARTQAFTDAMSKIMAEEEAALHAVDEKYKALDSPVDQTDTVAVKDVERVRRMKIQEQNDIRYRASQRRSPVLSDFTKDAVKGQSPEELAKAVEAAGRFYNVTGRYSLAGNDGVQ